MACSGSLARTPWVRSLGLVLLVIATPVAAMAQPRVGYHLGDVAPELTLTDQNGSTVSLSDFRGKNVLLTFAAEWCGPCQIAAPQAERLIQSLNKNDEPSALLEVLVQNDFGDPSETQDAQDWADAFGLTGPVLSADGDDQSPGVKQFITYSGQHGGPAFPTSVLLTPHGRIINVYVGFAPSRVTADFAKHQAYEPRGMVDQLLTVVERLGLPDGVRKSLAGPLTGLLEALDARDVEGGCNQLVGFLQAVQNQSGSGISADQATQLNNAVQKISVSLGCQ